MELYYEAQPRDWTGLTDNVPHNGVVAGGDGSHRCGVGGDFGDLGQRACAVESREPQFKAMSAFRALGR